MAARGEVMHRAHVQLPEEAKSPLRTIALRPGGRTGPGDARRAARLSRSRRLRGPGRRRGQRARRLLLLDGQHHDDRFGTKGRAAATTLLRNGYRPDQRVAIDERPAAREQATSTGLTAVAGSATTQHALLEAGIADAVAVVVALNRDDAAVLATLTARELNPKAHVVAAVREDENTHLLHESGAHSVITPPRAPRAGCSASPQPLPTSRRDRGSDHCGRRAGHRRAARRR
jgi:TrkA-N domain